MLFTEFDLNTAQEVWYEEGLEKGLLKGREEGRVEGREEGRVQGRVEGETTKAYEIAKKMLKRNRPINEIIEDTGLTIDEINALYKS